MRTLCRLRLNEHAYGRWVKKEEHRIKVLTVGPLMHGGFKLKLQKKR
jgi:hypothetical protein